MRIRNLNENVCADECGTVRTARIVDGAPVYRCPGCASEWIDLDERTQAPDPTAPAASGTAATPDARPIDGTPHAPTLDGEPRPAPHAGPSTPPVYPELLHTVLDARDIRTLAEFYRALLGLHYRPGDAPPFIGTDDADWLVLTHPDGRRALAFQADENHVPPTWPKAGVPQQLHLDMTVPDAAALAFARDRAVALGARILLDRTDDADEPLYVFADPAGHPFCIFVG